MSNRQSSCRVCDKPKRMHVGTISTQLSGKSRRSRSTSAFSFEAALVYVGWAAQQIVGRERRERVSQLAWRGGGCFDSRRRVNSNVRRHQLGTLRTEVDDGSATTSCPPVHAEPPWVRGAGALVCPALAPAEAARHGARHPRRPTDVSIHRRHLARSGGPGLPEAF